MSTKKSQNESKIQISFAIKNKESSTKPSTTNLQKKELLYNYYIINQLIHGYNVSLKNKHEEASPNYPKPQITVMHINHTHNNLQ